MKILYKPLLFATTLFLLLTIACCKDDCTDPRNPDCPNYVDCAKLYPPTSASFTIKEATAFVGLPDYLFIDTDTCYRSIVDFEAIDTEADSFIWQIGTEPEPRYGRKVRITFPDNMRGSTFTIRLIIKAKPNAICNPNDDGIDTVIRQFYFMKTGEDLSWEGTYYGSDEDKPDSLYTIVLGHNYDIATDKNSFLLFGIPRGCTDTLVIKLNNLFFSYKNAEIGIPGSNCSYKIIHCIKNNNNNTYTLTFGVRKWVGNTSIDSKRLFTGIKIK